MKRSIKTHELFRALEGESYVRPRVTQLATRQICQKTAESNGT